MAHSVVVVRTPVARLRFALRSGRLLYLLGTAGRRRFLAGPAPAAAAAARTAFAHRATHAPLARDLRNFPAHRFPLAVASITRKQKPQPLLPGALGRSRRGLSTSMTAAAGDSPTAAQPASTEPASATAPHPGPQAPTVQPRTNEDLQAWISAEGVSASLLRFDHPTDTCEESAQALDVSVQRARAIVKSLVFDACGERVLVLMGGDGMVCQRKLALLLGLPQKRVKLAKPEEALAATGFRIGTIPPFGHAAGRLPTLADAQIAALGEGVTVFGGGGAPSFELQVGELLRVTEATVADLRKGSAPAAPATPGAGDGPGGATPGAREGGLPRPADEAEIAEAIARAARVQQERAGALGVAPPAHGAGGVVMEATVLSARRVSRLLTFASLRVDAFDAGGDAGPGGAAPAEAWAGGQSLEVQAILGKTLKDNLGEEAAAEVMRAVARRGARLRLRGSFQQSPRPGAVDFVVAEVAAVAGAGAGERAAGQGDDGRAASTAERRDEGEEEEEEDDEEERVERDLLLLHLPEDAEDSAEGSPAVRRSERARAAAAATRGAVLGTGGVGPGGASGTGSRGGRFPLFQPPPEMRVTHVADLAALRRMRAAILGGGTGDAEEAAGASGAPVVALDCEWRPYPRGAAATPVALLQVATGEEAFLVDTLALFLSGSEPGASSEAAAFVRDLMASPRVLKLGFGFDHDLKRLAESFPELAQPPLAVASTVDLRTCALVAAAEALPAVANRRRLATVGLAALVRALLAVALDKRQQTSDWGARPLIEAQARYAAADVAVLHALFGRLRERSAALREALPELTAGPCVYPWHLVRSRELSAARALALPTGAKAPPAEISVLPQDRLAPLAGSACPGTGREAALALVAPGSRSSGRMKGGVVACANATLLFMNAGTGGKYPNEVWRGDEDGLLRVSWFGDAGEPLTGRTLSRIVGGQGGEMAAEAAAGPVLLFARVKAGPYVFMGRAESASAEPPEGPRGFATVELVLRDTAALEGSPAAVAVLQATGLEIGGRRRSVASTTPPDLRSTSGGEGGEGTAAEEVQSSGGATEATPRRPRRYVREEVQAAPPQSK